MRTTRLVGVFFFLFVLTLRAQPPGITTCLAQTIMIPHTDGWSGYIPQCLDTLRIGREAPMPPYGGMPPGTCAKLFQVWGWPRPNHTYREIPCEVICENSDRVLVIPHERLLPDTTQVNTINYAVQLYCEYWWGKNKTSVTEINFKVAPAFGAYARAIDVETGEELFVGQLVMPTYRYRSWWNTGGLDIQALSGWGYQFLYWKCSFPEIPLKPEKAIQRIETYCWPIGVETVFDAYFRKRPTSVGDVASSNGISIRHEGSLITVEREGATPARVTIIDLTGRVVYTSENTMQTHSISLQDLTPGLYFCQVHDESQSLHSPIHHY